MKFNLIIILSFLSIYFSHAQVENTKEAIVKNKVKSSTERHCFTGSSGSCTVIYEAYDRRGNMIEWDMGRLGTRYKYIYDHKDRKVATIWVDKIDSTKIDTIRFSHDKHNEIVSEKNNPYPYNSKNFTNYYDQKNRLTKRLSKSKNHENDSIIKTHIFEWTSFDKIKSEKSFIIKIGQEKDTLYPALTTYEYDIYENLTREIHYKDNEIVNTICYDYDTSLRLIQKKEYDEKSIEFWNNEYAEYKDRIEYYSTKITYDSKGRIKEKYTYFSDPCMSLDDHFTYKHFYKKNDLLHKVEVSRENKLRFTISYEYSFY